MVNACADPDFFVREGGGVQAQWRKKTALIFGFFSPKFSGDAGRGPTIYEGWGSKCLFL